MQSFSHDILISVSGEVKRREKTDWKDDDRTGVVDKSKTYTREKKRNRNVAQKAGRENE